MLTDLHVKPGQLRIFWRWRRPASAAASGSSPMIDMLSSPLAKAVLAGIATMVVKRVMGRSQTT